MECKVCKGTVFVGAGNYQTTTSYGKKYQCKRCGRIQVVAEPYTAEELEAIRRVESNVTT